MSEAAIIDLTQVQAAIARELDSRRFAPEPGCFADKRGGGETLYGLIGSANVYAVLGLDLGDRHARGQWARRILAHADENGC